MFPARPPDVLDRRGPDPLDGMRHAGEAVSPASLAGMTTFHGRRPGRHDPVRLRAGGRESGGVQLDDTQLIGILDREPLERFVNGQHVHGGTRRGGLAGGVQRDEDGFAAALDVRGRAFRGPEGWCVWSRASGVGRRHDPCSSEQGDEVSPVPRDREESPMKVLGKKRSRTEQVTDKVKEVVRDHPKGAAAAGLAAVTAAGAAAWLTKRSHGIADGTSFHVESDGNGAWLLKEDGVDEPVQRHATKREAISAAREYARKHNPSVLAIHREDGGVSKRHTYDDR